jgi:hypothetical protein
MEPIARCDGLLYPRCWPGVYITMRIEWTVIESEINERCSIALVTVVVVVVVVVAANDREAKLLILL